MKSVRNITLLCLFILSCLYCSQVACEEPAFQTSNKKREQKLAPYWHGHEKFSDERFSRLYNALDMFDQENILWVKKDFASAALLEVKNADQVLTRWISIKTEYLNSDKEKDEKTVQSCLEYIEKYSELQNELHNLEANLRRFVERHR